MPHLVTWWSTLRARSPVLAYTGLLHAALIPVTATLWTLDPTVVTGVNVWIKPMKFMVSIAIYVWTVAWLVGYLEARRRTVAVIAWGIASTMAVETVCLFVQAGRGTASHFNVATPFDAAIFGTMGVMIALDSLLMVGLLLLFVPRHAALSASYQWGIRLGIIVFLLGGAVGGQMVTHMAHTVGAPDGGPGLPFLDWSTVAGDLRIAHALGLHGLQLLPVLGFAIGRSPGRSAQVVWLVAAVYLLVVAAAAAQALAGVPLVRR